MLVIAMAPKVSSFMSSPVITAAKDDSLITIRNLMLVHMIGRVVILERGKVSGIVCRSDFTKIAFNRKRCLKPLDSIAVEEIMSTPVYAISPNKTLKSAAQFMIKHKIGSLPVIDANGSLVGIITKHDMLKAFSSKFYNIFKISDFMVEKPAVVSPTHSIYHIIDVLLQSEMKRIIVVDNSKPIGIITRSDILFTILGISEGFPTIKYTYKHFKNVSELLRTHSILTASDIMVEDPITVTHDEDLAMASDIMVKNRVECLPVVNSQGALVGLISKDDVIKALREI